MTKEIIQIITTTTHFQCEVCRTPFGEQNIAQMVNHYISEHGHKLLHIGTETSPGPNGAPWHATVAILGKLNAS